MASVIQLIKKRKGLRAEIARRCGIPRQNVLKWERVPRKHIKAVADLTGLPEKAMLAELDARWRIPAKELTEQS